VTLRGGEKKECRRLLSWRRGDVGGEKRHKQRKGELPAKGDGFRIRKKKGGSIGSAVGGGTGQKIPTLADKRRKMVSLKARASVGRDLPKSRDSFKLLRGFWSWGHEARVKEGARRVCEQRTYRVSFHINEKIEIGHWNNTVHLLEFRKGVR